MKDWGLRGLCFLQHFNTWLAQMLSSVQFSRSQWNELLICKCGRTVCVFVHIFPQSSEGAHSVHLWEWACWGKTLSMLHTKPSPSPSLSIFPSLPSSLPAAVFLSELESGAKLFFPPSSRHKQELTDLLTSTNTHSFFFLPLPCPTLIWLLTVYWPHFGLQTEGQVFPLFYLAAVIACSHCCVRTAWLFGEMLSW